MNTKYKHPNYNVHDVLPLYLNALHQFNKSLIARTCRVRVLLSVLLRTLRCLQLHPWLVHYSKRGCQPEFSKTWSIGNWIFVSLKKLSFGNRRKTFGVTSQLFSI